MNLGGGRHDLDEVSGVRVDGDAWLVPCPSRSPLSQHQGAVSLGRPPPPTPPPSLPMALRVSTMVLLSALWAGGWGLRAPLPLMGLGLLNRQVGSRAPHPLLDSRTYPLGRCVWPAFVH